MLTKEFKVKKSTSIYQKVIQFFIILGESVYENEKYFSERSISSSDNDKDFEIPDITNFNREQINKKIIEFSKTIKEKNIIINNLRVANENLSKSILP